MEVTTIVGIVIAVIIMLFGLRILLKKPADAAPSLESNLHIDKDSQQPVIPRHVRHQLHSTQAAEQSARVEPTLADTPVAFEDNPQAIEQKPMHTETVQAETVQTEIKAEQPAVVQNEPKTPPIEDVTELKIDEPIIQAPEDEQPQKQDAVPVQPETENTTPEFSLNNQIEKAEILEFEDESSILDEHLHEQQRVDEESALSTAVDFIALNIYPERRVLSGEKTLKVLLKYGLRFGEMACFHRYNQDDSKLLFSVLQITDEGAAGFDLETLSTEQVKGLAFFLALPHGDVQNAFDTMDSISRLIAREIDGTVYDQNNQEFTPQLREQWRHQAIDYRSGQTAEV